MKMWKSLAVLAASLGLVLLGAGPASAHGAMMKPGSRTFLCWEDGLSSTGQIVPQNPACSAAVSVSGANSLYNWFAVLRSDGAGRTRGFIPDGKLCSGGNPNYAGFDQVGDWPITHLTAGANFDFAYNAWAAHPGWFYTYVTKDGWDPSKPLTWDELEDQPFLTVDHPPVTGQVGTVNGQYDWSGALPANKTGRHIIYSVWKRSDSSETFYGCSDVTFDGGHGEVTGIKDAPPPPPPGDGDHGCMAEFDITNQWSGGYQATVQVMNHGTAPINGWTVELDAAGGADGGHRVERDDDAGRVAHSGPQRGLEPDRAGRRLDHVRAHHERDRVQSHAAHGELLLAVTRPTPPAPRPGASPRRCHSLRIQAPVEQPGELGGRVGAIAAAVVGEGPDASWSGSRPRSG